jgi:hypothetical protein
VEHGQVWSLALDVFGYRTPTSTVGERVVWRSEHVGRLFELLSQVLNLDIQGSRSGGRSTTVTEDKYMANSSSWRTVNAKEEEARAAREMIDSTSAPNEDSLASLILFPNVQSVNLVSHVISQCSRCSVTIINASKIAWHRRCAANSIWRKQCGYFVPTTRTLRHCTPRLLRSDYSPMSPVNR